MTLSIAFLLAVLALMAWLFLTEKLPVEVTAFAALAVLTMTGYVSTQEAFQGFASPAVATMVAGFVLSAALQHTGVADGVGSSIHRLVGDREPALIAVVMLTAALLSSVMPNVAATAVLMPTVAGLVRQSRVPSSRLFMPLAFGAVLGGTLTLIGTPPNLVAADVAATRELQPFGLFTFTPFGAILTLGGAIFMVFVGRRMLPERNPAGQIDGADLTRIYRLAERLFSIRVPRGSRLDGVSLREARLGTALGVNVTALIRDDRRRLAPPPDTRIQSGDVLVVEGRFRDLAELLRVRGLDIGKRPSHVRLHDTSGVLTGVLLRIGTGSPIAGHTVQQLRFRERYGGLVAAVWRAGERAYDRPGGLVLEEGDEILALGDRDEVEELAAHPDFEVLEIGPPTLRRLEETVFMVEVVRGSELDGVSVRDSRLGELVGLTIVARIAHAGKIAAVTPDEVLREGDQLLVSGEPTRVASLLRYGEIELGERTPDAPIESADVRVVEAIIAPRSRLQGRCLRELEFRERYGVQVLAVSRGGEPLHEGLADLALHVGDAVLLQGPRAKIALLARDPDFVFLTPGLGEPRRSGKAPFALGALALMVLLVATGTYPIQIAALLAALTTLLFGAVSMEQAYDAIDWRTVVLVAAVLPLGPAIEGSGVALWLADFFVREAGILGPYGAVVALAVLGSLLSQIVTGAPTIVMLAPIAFLTADRLGVRPDGLIMATALASSIAFLTPFSHKANLLVMSAGAYRPADFLRVGLLLSILCLVVICVMVPWLLPL